MLAIRNMSSDNASPTEAGSSLPVENIRQTRSKDLTRGPFKVAKTLVDAFSSTGRRAAPSSTKDQHARLISIGLSHYSEKVRWALDLLEADPNSRLYYTEDAHPPAFQSFATVPASNGEASRAPMIILDGAITPPGEESPRSVLFDSSLIISTLCPELYPIESREEIVQFEEEMGRRLGPTSRALVYHQVLRPEYYSLIGFVGGVCTSKIESILFAKMLPRGLAEGMRKLMAIDETSAGVSLEEVRKVFRDVSDRLEGGQKDYIFDSTSRKLGFTAADLTFAALATPLIRPPELDGLYGGPKFETRWPEALNSIRDELRATPAGKHALKMYHYHRFGVGRTARPNKSGQIIFPKSLRRNKVPGVGATLAIGAVAAIAVGGHHQMSKL
mmetsp:Transcript_28051/g.81086  ORF Transcript_28051/g.81086 Transcript_28051/m.81086 type:complete len:387 (+) Transcript_28051:85-1245(+)